MSSTDIVPLSVDFTESTQLYGYSTFYVGFNSVRDLKNLSFALYYSNTLLLLFFILVDPILFFLIYPSFPLCSLNVKFIFLIRLFVTFIFLFYIIVCTLCVYYYCYYLIILSMFFTVFIELYDYSLCRSFLYTYHFLFLQWFYFILR